MLYSENTAGYVDFDLDPSIFDEEMEITDENNEKKKDTAAQIPVTSTHSGPSSSLTEAVAHATTLPNRQDVENFIQEQENKNTLRKTMGDIKKLNKFMSQRGESRPMFQIPVEELDEHIAAFLLSVKKEDGSDYETTSIRNMVSSFDRKLRRHGYPHTIIGNNSNVFNLTKETLKAKLKMLKRSGKGNHSKEADAISEEDISTLYRKNLLASATPEAVINTVWLNNCLHFGTRGVSKHYELRWGDITLKENGSGQYLELNERQTKTRTGEQVSNSRKIKPKTFESTERNPIDIYKLYVSKRPANFSGLDSPFYLAPRTIPVENASDQWFMRQRIGFRKLSTLMKTMCEKAGITGKRLTNHSARKHLVQKLRDCNVPPTEIMQITGHKNVQSVINYSSISTEKSKEMLQHSF